MSEKKPTIPEVYPLIIDYYKKPENNCGGNLHCILDDPNFRDHDVMFCLEEARKDDDADGTRIAELLLRMSKAQRRRLYRLPHRSDDYGFSDPRILSS